MADIPEFSIAKLDVRAGDCIVVKTKHPITQTQAALLGEAAMAKLPKGVSVFVCDANFDLSVISREQIEQQGKASYHQ